MNEQCTMTSPETTIIEVWHSELRDPKNLNARLPFSADLQECMQIAAGRHSECVYKLVSLVTVPLDRDGDQSLETEHALEKAYELTNHINHSWHLNEGVREFGYQNRSTSTGDMLVTAGGQRWVVAAMGFKPFDLKDIN